MGTPIITVIVPFYQTDRDLFLSCADSILNDADAPIELIVVDDGSASEYLSVLEEVSSDKRVRVYHLPHCGVSAARNYGMDNAGGDWVTFVDADDTLEYNWFNEIGRISINNDADLICFSGGKDINGELHRNKFFLLEDTDYGSKKELKMQVMRSALSAGYLPRGYTNHYSLGSPCSKLYKTSFLRNNNLVFDTDVTFAEDTLFALNVYLRAKKIIYFDKYIYHYVLNLSSATKRFRPGLSLETTKFFEEAQKFIDENNLRNELNGALYDRTYLEMIRIMNLEFYNKENTDNKGERAKSVKKFLDTEPYKTVLTECISGKKGWRHFLTALTMKYGLYGVVIHLKDLVH